MEPGPHLGVTGADPRRVARVASGGDSARAGPRVGVRSTGGGGDAVRAVVLARGAPAPERLGRGANVPRRVRGVANGGRVRTLRGELVREARRAVSAQRDVLGRRAEGVVRVRDGGDERDGREARTRRQAEEDERVLRVGGRDGGARRSTARAGG